MVNDRLKAVLTMPLADPTPLGQSPDAHFTRQSTDAVAGFPCTVWDIQASGIGAKACITADGLLPRMDAMGMVLTATAVWN